MEMEIFAKIVNGCLRFWILLWTLFPLTWSSNLVPEQFLKNSFFLPSPYSEKMRWRRGWNESLMILVLFIYFWNFLSKLEMWKTGSNISSSHKQKSKSFSRKIMWIPEAGILLKKDIAARFLLWMLRSF